jgi:hypothetical protein
MSLAAQDLDSRDEDGYDAYRQLLGEQRALFTCTSAHGNGVISVVQYGPWRVLLFEDIDGTTVSQGLTFHTLADGLVPSVVGFEYERNIVAAVAAVTAIFGPAVRDERPARALLVGLGSGSCAAALHHLAGQTVGNRRLVVEVVGRACTRRMLGWMHDGACMMQVEHDPRVIRLARKAHGMAFRRIPAHQIVLDIQRKR